MTDLMSTLYDYVLTQSESYLAVYPEYRDFCRRGNCGSGIRRSRRPHSVPPWRCAGS